MNIYALSSGKGPSGIAIIRLSGKNALEISELLSKKKNIKSKEINICKFYNPIDNTLIDEGLLVYFPGPNSFTGDNVVEFHGGEISEPLIADNHFTAKMSFDVTFKDRGRQQMEEVCVFEVNDGKIVNEQFFYTM